MRHLRILSTLVCSILSWASVHASTITIAARGNARVLDASNGFLPNGCLVQVGKFNAGFNPAANTSNLALLKSNFVVLHTSTTITESSRVGTINDVMLRTGLTGTKLYIWIYNAPAETTANQHGLFTEPSWIAPGDEPPTDTLTLSLGSTSLQALIGSVGPPGKLTAITPPASYSTWAGSYFNSTQLANPAISGDDATPAGDGVSNLLKYAFGLPPLTPIAASGRPAQAVVPVTGSQFLGISFRRNRSAPDLTFEVQFSNANGSWPTGASPSATVSSVDLGDGSDLVTIRDTTPILPGQPARLARLKVTR